MTASLDDLKRIEFRTAKVVEVNEHPNADRLLVLKVDTGTEQKEVVAGIKQHYPKESLLNKTVILVNNLAPATIRGVTSNGMLLAAKSGTELTLLTTDGELPPGAIIS